MTFTKQLMLCLSTISLLPQLFLIIAGIKSIIEIKKSDNYARALGYTVVIISLVNTFLFAIYGIVEVYFG